jgi:hypothetical protein
VQYFFSCLAFSVLGVAIGTTIAALMGNYRWYWIAALAMWIFSFLTGFSIGIYALSATFSLTALALGYSLRLIR